MVVNGRCWLFGMNVGGCLELSLVVVWNSKRWWTIGNNVHGCLEWTLVVRS